MNQSKVIKKRKCHKCGEDVEADSKGIKDHFLQCRTDKKRDVVTIDPSESGSTGGGRTLAMLYAAAASFELHPSSMREPVDPSTPYPFTKRRN